MTRKKKSSITNYMAVAMRILMRERHQVQPYHYGNAEYLQTNLTKVISSICFMPTGDGTINLHALDMAAIDVRIAEMDKLFEHSFDKHRTDLDALQCVVANLDAQVNKNSTALQWELTSSQFIGRSLMATDCRKKQSQVGSAPP
jgi:hypothetical protein